MKKCPYCAEPIQDDAKKCRFCGEWIIKEKKKNKFTINKFTINQSDVKQFFLRNIWFLKQQRISRKSFLIMFGASLLLYIITYGVFYLGQLNNNIFTLIPSGIALIFLFLLIIEKIIKRLYDMNYSPWLLLIPIINLLLVLGAFFIEGTKGSNKFGPDNLYSPIDQKKLWLKITKYIVLAPAAAAIAQNNEYKLSGETVIGGVVFTLILVGIRKLVIYLIYRKENNNPKDTTENEDSDEELSDISPMIMRIVIGVIIIGVLFMWLYSRNY